MTTVLQQRHARRIQQYQPLVPSVRAMLATHKVEVKGELEITLIWGRIGQNVKYLRVHYLIDGQGPFLEEQRRPHFFSVEGSEVESFMRQFTEIVGDESWNVGGLEARRDRGKSG